MGADKQPWEMLSDETDNAYVAFQCYLELGGTRSVRKASVEYTKRNTGAKRGQTARGGTIDKWATKHRWTERARAYDDHMARVAVEAKEQGTRDWVTELVEANKEILRLVYERLKEMLSLPATTQTVTRQIKVAGQMVDQQITVEGANYRLSELASILEKSDKIMRLFIGDPTERIAGNIQIGLSLLTGKGLGEVVQDPEQYAALLKIAENVAEKHAPAFH